MKVINLLSWVGDVFLLSLFWVVGSLPIFTVGASTMALLHVFGEKLKGENVSVVSTFFGSYKKNFVCGLGVSMILGLIWFLTISYVRMAVPTLGAGFSMTMVLLLIVLFEAMMVSLYFCGLRSRYELNTLVILKNAVIFVHGYFKESVKGFGLIIVFLFLTFWFPPLFIVLPGAIGLICSTFLKISIDKYSLRLEVIEKLKKEEEKLSC